MRTKIITTLSLLGIIALTTVAQDKFDYFGQTPPKDSAVVFAPGIISLADADHHIGKVVFSPDGKECYISVWRNNFSSAKIYYTKREGDSWSQPAEAPFSIGYYANGAFFSKDGNKLFFNRGTIPKIWMVQRTSQGWSDPKKLPSPINSDSLHWDYDYSETADGTAYFCSNRPGGQGHDLWRSQQIQGQSIQIENLDTIVNSAASEFCSLIAPDGSYLIFSSERPGGYGYSSLYVTFNKGNGNWTKPVTMEKNGAGINIKNTSWFDPSLSPDGRYLFFNTKGEVYWISTKVIDDIKKEVFNPKITK